MAEVNFTVETDINEPLEQASTQQNAQIQPFHTSTEVAQGFNNVVTAQVEEVRLSNEHDLRQKYTPEDLLKLRYVDADEIAQMVGVTGVSVNNRLRGFRRCKIGGKWIWERTPELKNFIDSWITIRANGGA